MSEQVTLNPGHYAKLGSIHCGVLRDHVAICAGDRAQVADGERFHFDRAKVSVSRKGDAYTFTHD